MELPVIIQTENNTCLACVLAMIVGETEKYVLDWFTHIEPPFNDEDAYIFLAHHGIYLTLCANTQRGKFGRRFDGTEDLSVSINLQVHWAYMVVESQSKEGREHAVFWNTKHILDPMFSEPQKIENYKIKYIYPLLTTEKRQTRK